MTSLRDRHFANVWRAAVQLVLMTGVLMPVPILAQTVVGVIVDSATARPIAGAVVSATSASGEILRNVLSGAGGKYVLNLPLGSVSMRVRLIGYRPQTVPLPSASAAQVSIDVRLPLLKTMLDVVDVRANSQCSARRDRAAASALFEQIRIGLAATIVAAQEAPADMKVIRYERVLNASGNQILYQDVAVDSLSSMDQSFVAARSAAQFVDSGFVNDATSTREYLAPDAAVLTDDAFRNAYCFQIGSTPRNRRGQIGLQFASASRQGRRVDIQGTVWVDSASRSLRDIEFLYVGLPPAISTLRPGGSVAFHTMPNGTVLIDRWALRLITERIVTVVARVASAGPPLREVTVFDVYDTGGELAGARWEDGSTWKGSLATLRFTAQTPAGLPQPLITLALPYSSYRETTNTLGKAEMIDVLPGPYRVVVIDDELEKVDVQLETPVAIHAVRDSVHGIEFTAPNRLDYAKKICPPEPTGGVYKRSVAVSNSQTTVPRVANMSVAFFVYVTTADGKPVPNVKITEAVVTRNDRPLYRNDAFGGKTDSGGRYYSCWNFALDETVQVWMAAEGQAPVVIEKKLTDKVHAFRFVVP